MQGASLAWSCLHSDVPAWMRAQQALSLFLFQLFQLGFTQAPKHQPEADIPTWEGPSRRHSLAGHCFDSAQRPNTQAVPQQSIIAALLAEPSQIKEVPEPLAHVPASDTFSPIMHSGMT